MMSIFGYVSLSVIMFVATLGGSGGAAFMFPVNLIFFGLSVRGAVAHTSLFVCISSLGRVVIELVTTWKNIKDRRINFHIVIISAPVMFLGSFIGVNLNTASPNPVILIVMTVVLLFATYKLFVKYRSKKQAETERELAKMDALSEDDTMDMALSNGDETVVVQIDPEGDNGNYAKVASVEVETTTAENGVIVTKQITIENDENYIQLQMDALDLIMLVVIFMLNPLLAFFRGTKAMESFIHNVYCTTEDILIIGIYIVVILVLSGFNCARMIKRSANIEDSEKQIKLTMSSITKYLGAVFVIGMMGSYISVGMSVLFTLNLLSFGLSPFVSSPTALVLSALTSGSSSILYLLNGQLCFIYAVIGSAIIIVFSLGTRLTLYEVIMKSGKESVLLLCLVFMIGLSIPTNLAKILPGIIANAEKGINIWAFTSPCPSTT